MPLLIATRNAHKLSEIRQILQLPDSDIVGVDTLPDLPDVEEDRDTFEGNAAKKALTLATASGMMTLADDSGLEVDALDGAPGVYSARYAGEPSNDAANNRKLLDALADATERTARFRCAIALATPEGQWDTVDGRCEGMIGFELRGDCGFGYDPLFIPDGYAQSFGELDATIKHRISHRGAALASALAAWWDGTKLRLT